MLHGCSIEEVSEALPLFNTAVSVEKRSEGSRRTVGCTQLRNREAVWDGQSKPPANHTVLVCMFMM